ncbi:protein DpdG [Kribbella sp. NPDC051718]|uniref:protein DpdG n=1 Tax=Kribbella sp. NPDC051718 TaxID=3155168 RepID=UPI0034438537
MAVLNPPRALPGLGRTIINLLLESQRSWDEDALLDVFKPSGLNEDITAQHGVKNTILALRSIGLLTIEDGLTPSEAVLKHSSGHVLSRTSFRRLLQIQVLDTDRDGDPWQIRDGEGNTSGARDITRALSWFLAQDALGGSLTWTASSAPVQTLQLTQFPSNDNETWALTNDTRWGAFSRWAPALGLVSPSLVQKKPGLIPLPTTAIDDVLDELPAGRIPINQFLTQLALALPVLHGSVARTSLAALLGTDPDPGVAASCADSSVGQALRILADRGRVTFETLADAEGVRLSRYDEARITHVTLKRGAKR